MGLSIEPSQVSGTIKAPPSKSMTQRAIAAALLADGETAVLNPSFCDDSLAAMSIAEGLGASVESSESELRITGSRNLKSAELNCRESGLAIRMFSPIAALFPAEIKITGDASLKKRPMMMITEALSQLGVRCTSAGGFLPLTIHGPMKSGHCVIDGSISSQLLTGLLMALPLTSGNSQLEVINLKSKPYIDMTLELLREFGIMIENKKYTLFIVPGNQKYQSKKYIVEGDWSGGAFLLVAGAINGNLKILGLRPDSRQSDVAVIKALRMAGARMDIGAEAIEISRSDLKCFEFDATESPDLFPPLVALASYCKGTTLIKGVSRLIHKESNRAAVLKEEFGRMDINIEINNDVMSVTGGKPAGAEINPHGDHRIAMAAAVAAVGASGKVIIHDPQCVAKSYPGFFEDLRKIGTKTYK
ncbi:MAG: 3-phosphoshikimate 1-carboxyvinyltransferase [Bacteroidales bacterium]|nr:3-phosphoshikimate 1-carboxyvinyltransferase [Bacteroidales bacterium]